MRLHTLAAKVAVMLCIAGTVARAEPETIALLSLDADERLEIYGQPVAAEIARVLIAAKLDVVVVDAKMAVPTTARLVIDGSIAQRGSTVLLEIRVRNPVDGGTFDKLEQRASSVAAISKNSVATSRSMT